MSDVSGSPLSQVDFSALEERVLATYSERRELPDGRVVVLVGLGDLPDEAVSELIGDEEGAVVVAAEFMPGARAGDDAYVLDDRVLSFKRGVEELSLKCAEPMERERPVRDWEQREPRRARRRRR